MAEWRCQQTMARVAVGARVAVLTGPKLRAQRLKTMGRARLTTKCNSEARPPPPPRPRRPAAPLRRRPPLRSLAPKFECQTEISAKAVRTPLQAARAYFLAALPDTPQHAPQGLERAGARAFGLVPSSGAGQFDVADFGYTTAK